MSEDSDGIEAWFSPTTTAYSTAVAAAICRHLAAGATIKLAAEAEGVSEATFFNWRRAHPEFMTATRRARARGAVSILDRLATAGSRDWRADLERLVRAYPSEYGSNQPLRRQDHEAIVAALTRTIDIALDRAGVTLEMKQAIALAVIAAADEQTGQFDDV